MSKPSTPPKPGLAVEADGDRAAALRELEAAMDEYKRTSGRLFPTWTEVLEVLGKLGYHKAD
ncbi:hypothetical protein ACYOEI_11335 [Singulisphaera rosea]